MKSSGKLRAVGTIHQGLQRYKQASRPRQPADPAHTVKGYGQGEAGEGRNIRTAEEAQREEIAHFRSRFEIPIQRKRAHADFLPGAFGQPGDRLHA